MSMLCAGGPTQQCDTCGLTWLIEAHVSAGAGSSSIQGMEELLAAEGAHQAVCVTCQDIEPGNAGQAQASLSLSPGPLRSSSSSIDLLCSSPLLVSPSPGPDTLDAITPGFNLPDDFPVGHNPYLQLRPASPVVDAPAMFPDLASCFTQSACSTWGTL